MTRAVALCILLSSTLAFANIHGDCHADPATEVGQVNRIFAVGYVGGILDTTIYREVNGRRVYTVPEGFTYETGFTAVCAEIDKHSELWERASREAIMVAVNVLWKRKD